MVPMCVRLMIPREIVRHHRTVDLRYWSTDIWIDMRAFWCLCRFHFYRRYSLIDIIITTSNRDRWETKSIWCGSAFKWSARSRICDPSFRCYLRIILRGKWEKIWKNERNWEKMKEMGRCCNKIGMRDD